MAKITRRVGIVFFVAVITILLLVGCAISVNAITNEKYSTMSSKGNINNAIAVQEIVYDFELAGNCTQMAEKWNQAVKKSLDNGGVNVNVRLLANWTAQTDADYVTAFGKTEDGFKNGSILVPQGANIMLDLNGKTINRNLAKAQDYGVVFYLNGGSLTIEDHSLDNVQNANDIFSTYDMFKDSDVNYIYAKIKDLRIGKITGGADANTGGGILMQNNSTFTLNNGTILDNINAASGGAIYAQDSEVNINGGVLMNNSAKQGYGGGIYSTTSTLNLNGGIILGNNSTNKGGGIYSVTSTIKMTNTIIHGNNANYGGGICFYDGKFDLHSGTIRNNYSRVDGGGIYIAKSNLTTEDVKSVINMYGSEIFENTASYGAGVYLTYGAEGVINGGIIKNNKSWGNSTGLMVYNSATCVINDITITGNELYKNGSDGNSGGVGCMVGAGAELVFNGGLIENNKVVSNVSALKTYGGGILISGVVSGKSGIVKLNGGTIQNNSAMDGGGGIYDATDMGEIHIGGSVKIKNNIANNQNSDIYLIKGKTINIAHTLTKYENPQIGIHLADDYGNNVFTTNYTTNNSGNPYEYFFSNNGAKIAFINNEEVMFEDAINSNIYDFVYLDNGVRKSYKDNNLIHTVNDYDMLKSHKMTHYILGNIAPNTSINEFVNNLVYDKTQLEIYNNKNKLIYDKGVAASGITEEMLNQKYELAVGTGWYIKTNAETIYLSVLGDVTGDGRISAVDVTYLRQVANDKEAYDDLSVEKKLASLVLNVGIVTTADAEIIRNIMDNKITIDLFY